MKSNELREKFIKFFEGRGHKVIPSASLVPENDPTALFISAGMQPLVPYLLGEKHPLGKRLVDSQKCIRTDDIEEVGDKCHHTFLEMLGNWSLGDYFKQDSIQWSHELLFDKKWFALDSEKLAVSVFAGDEDAPFDEESYQKWIDLGIRPDRIAKLPKKNNWWGPVGEQGPCGPDTEMFYWTGNEPAPANFQSTNDDPNWVEIWNNVFMEYNKTSDGKFQKMGQKNVDTGMGFERILSVVNGLDDNYTTDLYLPIIEKIEEISGKRYDEHQKKFRIIADHIKAATFAINDGVLPSNKSAGYVVRRLIRRAIVKANQLGVKKNFTAILAEKVFEIYDNIYFSSVVAASHAVIPAKAGIQILDPRVKPEDDNVGGVRRGIISELEKEEEKFRKTIENGMTALKKVFGLAIGGIDPDNLPKGMVLRDNIIRVDGKIVFDIYQTFGFPIELSQEIMTEWGLRFDDQTIAEAQEALNAHQELSRTASAGMFKGGLADSGEEAIKYHTATHLLHQALREVLGESVGQKGSNINAERMRFDFTYAEKMTPEQIKQVEEIVNEKIEANLPVTMEEMSPEEAKESGAIGLFEHKYGDKVKVYSIDKFSREICGGPHVSHSAELGHFKILKEESSSAGVRRIKAVLE